MSRYRLAISDLSGALARQAMLVATVCLVADVAAFLVAGPVATLRPQDWVVLAAIAAADAALALPARYSGWVALAHAVLLVGAAALLGGSSAEGRVSDAGALVAGYRAGAWLRGGAAWLALAAMILGIGGAQLLFGMRDGDLLPIHILKNAVLPWLVGRYTTARRAYLAELEQRAETQRRDAEAAVEHAVAEERSAIARDLHDVISHHVSAIGAHAGAARLGLRTANRPDAVAGSLAAVETSSRAAMLDLRRLLDLLHGDQADMSRQPGLDNLEELLDGVRRAGLATRLSTHGAARPLPGSLDVAIYRIIQEMLTNALRHGDGATVEIELHYRAASVSVTARNGVPPARDGERNGAARGLVGIRKRAALFDGTVAYGAELGGDRWETTATFPLGDER
ncbi:sensor histidine kinase [Actinophytocola sp.]|jgi:signal transduction histidine kinase|uniref:sensor histidine kinase n=1 Tax=Actinophytocola sp. TaxID=1872138 RepID=UPI002ED94D98